MRVVERFMTVAARAGLALAAPVAAVAVALVLACGPAAALAGEWQLRMPVSKTARMTLPEAPAPATAGVPSAPGQAPAAPDASGKGPSGKAAPKTVLGRAAEAAAAEKPAPKSEAKPPAKPAAKPEAPKPDAPKAPEPSERPAPAPAKTVPASAAVDPKALVLPEPRPQGAPLPLPQDGKWAGDMILEYQPDRVILRVSVNAAVERVTWFNLADPAGPRKLAVDLRGPWRKRGAPVLRCDTGPVKAVVAGEHQDRLRLTIEFRNGAVARELEPELGKAADGLSIAIPLAVRLDS